jgi:uncharacterized membrane protein YhhN
MSMFFFTVYALAGLFHLWALWRGGDSLRNISKIALMPLLLGAYLASARHPNIIPALGILAGWGGDIFLLNPGSRRKFTGGLLCFLCGHFLYIFFILSRIGAFHLPVLAFSGAVGVVLILGSQRFIRPEASMRLPVLFYSLVLTCLGIAALQLLSDTRSLSGALVFAGSLLFMISDTLLGRFTFVSMPRFGNIWIMLPYILAQSAIAGGLARLAG